jgi:hypothetical protein
MLMSSGERYYEGLKARLFLNALLEPLHCAQERTKAGREGFPALVVNSEPLRNDRGPPLHQSDAVLFDVLNTM